MACGSRVRRPMAVIRAADEHLNRPWTHEVCRSRTQRSSGFLTVFSCIRVDGTICLTFHHDDIHACILIHWTVHGTLQRVNHHSHSCVQYYIARILSQHLTVRWQSTPSLFYTQVSSHQLRELNRLTRPHLEPLRNLLLCGRCLWCRLT